MSGTGKQTTTLQVLHIVAVMSDVQILTVKHQGNLSSQPSS